MILEFAAKLWHLEPISIASIASATVPPIDKIKSLGIMFDIKLSFDKYVNKICQILYFHIRALQRIRSLLLADIANSVACAIVGDRLDYCNSILYNI